MTKNELIEKLQAIKGNPQIKLWNGLVGDWMDIGDIQESRLVKMSQAHMIEMCRLEDVRDGNRDKDTPLTENELQYLRKCWKDNYKFEENPYVTDEDVKLKRYTAQRVFFIDAKLRGARMVDRLGEIQY